MQIQIPISIKLIGQVTVNVPRGTSSADVKRIAEERATKALDRALLSKRTLRTLDTGAFYVRAGRPR